MNHRLTGRVRFMHQVRGIFQRKVQLVVQVEETYDDGPTDHNGMPEYLAGTAWRDAQVKDLDALDIKLFIKP